MHRLAVFGPSLVAVPLSEYLAVLGYDVSSHTADELDGFVERPSGDGNAPPPELVILDLPASYPQRQVALSALRQLRYNGIPGVILLNGLSEGARRRESELRGSAEAVLPKPLHLGSLAAVCSRVLGTAG